ncbi:MAG: hypothetical protein F6J98_35890 [Moorea sp. SIO4G2]|nr:hypothetical protein [Moorena sp. SIO4G2]
MGRVGRVGRWGDGNPPLTPPRRGIWGDGGDFYKAMQRGLGGFPHERLHQDRVIILT